MRVASVHVYPVKSGRGVDLAGSPVELWGLRHDRRWMAIDANGVKLTARSHPALLAMTAFPDETGGLTFTAAGVGELAVPVPLGGPGVAVGISRLDRAVSAGAAAADWMTSLLGEAARLVWLDDPGRRSVAADHGGRPGDALSLADAGPLLLTTEASLRRLQEWTDASGTGTGRSPLAMARFRPNVVVAGDLEPFVEDTWMRIRIGGVDYRFAEQCDRCVMTTYDPDTLVRGHEPLRTLAKHRRRDGKVWFGVRFVPLDVGRIDIGDRVEVLESGRRLA